MIKESAVERALVEAVRQRGGMAIKLAPTMAGLPDRLVLWPDGRHAFVELKGPTGKLTAVQAACHRRLRGLAQPVCVLDSLEAVAKYAAGK